MNTHFLCIIKQIIAEQGESILADPQRLKGFVRDLAQDVPRPERIAFGRCIQYGAYTALKNSDSSHERQRIKQTLAQKIYEEEGVDKPLCMNTLDMLETIIADNHQSAHFIQNTPPEKQPVPVKAKITAMKIAGCIGVFCLLIFLKVVRENAPVLIKNRALEITAANRKNSLPLPPPVLETGWERVELSGIGSLDIPPNMEMQTDKTGIISKLYDDFNIPPGSIVFQQRGLNENEPESFQTFARVTIQTVTGNTGEFSSLYFPVPLYQTDELKDIDTQFKASTINGHAKLGIKVLDWYPPSLKTVNGMSCMYYGFTRQLNNNPVVLVHYYMFQNIDEMYILTLSYQLEKEDIWKTDFEKILDSFRITNINSETEK